MVVIVVCAACLMGIVAGDLHRLDVARLTLAAAIAGLAAALARRRPKWYMIALVACALAIGGVRAALPAVPGPAPPAALIGLRTAAAARIASELPEPQASLASGVLLGGAGGLNAAFKSQLQRAGLTHVLAIDGFKEVVVAAVVGSLGVRLLGARLAALPMLGAIAAYTLLTGAHPSAVRAALMVVLAQLAALSGRVPDPLTGVLLALTLMAMLDPHVVLEVGLQLSVSAVLGIVLLWPRLLRRPLRRLPHAIGEPIGLTLAVTLATLPVALTAFHVVSLVSPLAHVVAVPLLPVVLVGAGLLAVVAPLPVLGTAAAWLAWLPTTALASTVQLFGSLPGAAISTGRLPAASALFLAAALLVLGIWCQPELAEVRRAASRWRSAHHAVLMPVACIVACLGAAVVVGWTRPDGQVHIDPLVLDRGQAVFVRDPTGGTALIVLGRANALALVNQVADHLTVWEHKLDTVVVVDPDAARSVSLTLARYPADRLIQPVTPETRVSLANGAALDISTARGQLALQLEPPRSSPTTSAARPGSAN